MIPKAHFKKGKNNVWNGQLLSNHLNSVAEKAAEFANSFSASDWAWFAGRFHDLGKADPAWQNYLQKSIKKQDDSFCLEKKLENLSGNDGFRVQHSDAGTMVAIEKSIEKYKKEEKTPSPLLLSIPYCIAGHHAGLANYISVDAGNKPLLERLKYAQEANALERVISNLHDGGNNKTLSNSDKEYIELDEKYFEIPENIKLDTPKILEESYHMWIRMLYSCLVDADFLDTEEFMNPERAALRGQYDTLIKISEKFSSWMEKLQKNAPDNIVNRCRKDVFDTCVKAADGPEGIYSLTVPTGGGKTFSSFAFALKHALKYRKKRIIYAIPYTSIIEQTVDCLKEALGDGFEKSGLTRNVLEHHSNINLKREETQSHEEITRMQLASENWEAPVVVTTNVQLFESLLANKSSKCRKLHNIVNSVIILDEAQMLPLDCLKPILAVLQTLTEYFGVTVLLCTATQPVFQREFEDEEGAFEGLKGIREIIPNIKELADKLKRVDYIENKYDLKQSISWKSLANDIAEEHRALVIVNRRQDCLDMFNELQTKFKDDFSLTEDAVSENHVNIYHLSGNMCAEHRSSVIAEIKQKLLKTDERVYVVSTQLVEAGVDLDFPAVYRAASGLDSIVQAGGRCNREGKMQEHGRLYVFLPEKISPGGFLLKGETTFKSMLQRFKRRHKEFDLWDSKVISQYYNEFYNDINSFDKAGYKKNLLENASLCQLNFASFAEKFHMIYEYGYTVFTRYRNYETGACGDELVERLLIEGPHKSLMRELQRYTVTLSRYVVEKLVDDGVVAVTEDGIFYQTADYAYDENIGITVDTATDVFLGI